MVGRSAHRRPRENLGVHDVVQMNDLRVKGLQRLLYRAQWTAPAALEAASVQTLDVGKRADPIDFVGWRRPVDRPHQEMGLDRLLAAGQHTQQPAVSASPIGETAVQEEDSHGSSMLPGSGNGTTPRSSVWRISPVIGLIWGALPQIRTFGEVSQTDANR
jgi:hypothetical protein